jgi:hypothetical protein
MILDHQPQLMRPLEMALVCSFELLRVLVVTLTQTMNGHQQRR